MFSSEIENLVIKLLLTIINKEKEIEINRQILSQNIDFDIFQLYSFLDSQKKNCIDSSNIIDFLNKNGIYPNKLDIDFLIYFYDENKDNRISYTEFLNMILSNNNNTLRNFAKKNIGSYLDNNISEEIEILFLKLLENEIDLINNINRIINEIKGQCDFDICSVFQLLIGCQPLITIDSLKYFLNKNYVSVNEQDLINILKRFALNKNGKVDFNDFHHFFCFQDPNCRCLINKPNVGLSNNISISKNNCKFNSNENLPQMNIRFNPNIENRIYNNNLNVNYNNKYFEKSDFNFYDNNSLSNASFNENPNEISKNLYLRNSPQRFFQNKNNNNYNNIYNNNNNEFSTNRSINIKNIQNNINNTNNLNDLNNIPQYNPNYCEKCNNFPCICNLIPLRKNELDFINYLKECINIETKIEKAKIDLSLKSDFNIEDAFKIFEMDNRKFISDADLIYGLNSFEIYPSRKDIQLIKKRLNINKTENIFYSDFFDLIVPFEKDYRNMIERRNSTKNVPKFNKQNIFLQSTKNYFSSLINLIISCENKIENLRSDLNDVRNDINNIFWILDKYKIGNINDMDLNNYLKSRDIYINDIENSLLFIRLDKNKDGKIECWELNEELQMIR